MYMAMIALYNRGRCGPTMNLVGIPYRKALSRAFHSLALACFLLRIAFSLASVVHLPTCGTYCRVREDVDIFRMIIPRMP
jgi:hypothetical protein